MKRRFIALLCAVVLCFSLAAPALAAARASYYFSCTDVRAYATGGGEVLFEIDIDATHGMLEVGAEVVFVYEQQADGEYEVVYTFELEDNDYMTVENSWFACIDVRYQGTPGTKYFADVGCYARDENGSETLYFLTNVVTA